MQAPFSSVSGRPSQSPGSFSAPSPAPTPHPRQASSPEAFVISQAFLWGRQPASLPQFHREGNWVIFLLLLDQS